jgi:hypothetical protein
MEPTIENRQVAKRRLEETPFTVTYFMNANPFEPVALEKAMVQRNPFKYRTYAPTPPTSPSLSSATPELRGNAVSHFAFI